MVMSADSFAAPTMQVAPRYIPDLRPSADAAAIRREDRPAPSVVIPPFDPPSPTQTAAVSRSMMGPNVETEELNGARVEKTPRTLKPYGIAMLPRTEVVDGSGTQHKADQADAETAKVALDERIKLSPTTLPDDIQVELAMAAGFTEQEPSDTSAPL